MKEQAIQRVAVSVGSRSGGFFGRIFWFLLGNWRISIGSILILVIFISVGIQSAQQESLKPLVDGVGGRLFALDTTLYNQLSNPATTYPKYNPPENNIRINLWKAVLTYYGKVFWYFFLVLESLYIMFLWFWLFYKIGHYITGYALTATLFSLFITTLFFMLFNLLFIISQNALIEPPQAIPQQTITDSFKIYRGLYQIPLFISKINDPAFQLAITTYPLDTDKRLNITNITTTNVTL